MHYQLYTLDGKALLEYARINIGAKVLPAINFSEEIILSYKKREDSALFYQLAHILKDEIAPSSSACFDKHYFYVDFSAAKPIDEEPFSKLFNDGFSLNFGGKTVHYVPFITSQSQSKNFIYSFVREDIFGALLPRLDLDLPLEKDARNKSLAYLSKLYAYRALYMSSATEALRCSDPLGPDFLNCENIIVLPEKSHNPENAVPVFTANTTKEFSRGGDAVLCPEETTATVSLTCFDGEGLISPAANKIINGLVPEKLKGNSFQIRMPFLKGVLHTVDFHAFLKDKGVTGDEAFVTDAFGVRRNLFKANVIIRPSVFKLAGLIKSLFPDTDKRDEYFKACVADGDIMKYYFEKLKKYNHGLYVVKSENSFHNTQYVHLSSQQLSTFDLTDSDLDGIVAEHIALADAYNTENLTNKEKREELFKTEDKASWMELLLKDERFLKDPHIKSTVRAHRVSLYNDIALGKILVRGENRFLSGDLYAFLVDMLERVEGDICFDFSGKLLKNGGVYMPGVAASGQRVALIRSPHLSRNEDVCTILKTKKEYDTYLGHLTGVVITGDTSYIPAALGGADFDGDHISIIYDRRIIDACFKSGYTEIRNVESRVPFIHIKEIKAVLPPEKARIKRYNYICPQVVYTTFSNRIGQISNTAMKIAAVQYDPALKKSEGLPSAALCTILTGNEIDATKKGIRPYIDDVQRFAKSLDSEAKAVVKEIENYIEMKRCLENKKGEIPEIIMGEDGNFCLAEGSNLPVKTFKPNAGRGAVAQLLYRWAKAFYEFREEADDLAFDRNALLEIFNTKPKKSTLCKDIVAAFRSADGAFSDVLKARNNTSELSSKLNAMVTVRLKGQYDNVYTYTKDSLSYKDRFEIFKDGLFALTEKVDKDELKSLKDLLYSVGENKFNAETFWPYVKDKAAKKNKLLKEILALDHADLLLNFNFEGYRLLHYALEEAIARKNVPDLSKRANKNEYTKKYFAVCEEAIKAGVGKTKFQQTLADIALEDLGDSEGLDLWHKEQENELIARLYPQYDASLTNTFWKIFSEAQVIEALGGRADA